MKVVCNAVAAKLGGAANYLRCVAHELAIAGPEHEFIWLVPPEYEARGMAPNLRFHTSAAGHQRWWKRTWFDQVELRRLLYRERADVLFSTANFAMLECPVPQVLLVRNALYYSADYWRNIVLRKSWRSRLDLRIRRYWNCVSVRVADVVMAPTNAMMKEVRSSVSFPEEKALVNPYGVQNGLQPARFQDKSDSKDGKPWILLYSSLYGEHKNLSTLFRALIHLAAWGVKFRFVTPADPSQEDARWTCTWREDARLAAEPCLRDSILFTGRLAPEQLAELYRHADVFVQPSSIESFGHPLAEAMAAGLPIVAADSAVNRELAEHGAVYFPPHDAVEFATQIRLVLENATLRARLRAVALQRSRFFSWRRHAHELLAVFDRLTGSPCRGRTGPVL